jgi:uncharacterized caspase-like protein
MCRSRSRLLLLVAAAVVVGLGATLLPGDEPKPGKDAAQAAETFAKGGKWAVLIGIDNYFDDTIPPLRYAGADARLLAKVLEQCGYPRDHFLLRIDAQDRSYLKLLRPRLLEQLAGLLEKAKEGDTVVVYFSGHLGMSWNCTPKAWRSA